LPKKVRTKYFTGIGARATPRKDLQTLRKISRFLVLKRDFRLRSGHAAGADRACENGAGGFADIYLPWKTYGQYRYQDDAGMKVFGKPLVVKIENAEKWPEHFDLISAAFSQIKGGSFRDLSRGVAALLFRNSFQVVGHVRSKKTKEEILRPSKLVVCYHEGTGGTLYAVHIAESLQIPVVNVREKSFSEVLREVKKILRGE
jgi:hypothetical protein